MLTEGTESISPLRGPAPYPARRPRRGRVRARSGDADAAEMASLLLPAGTIGLGSRTFAAGSPSSAAVHPARRHGPRGQRRSDTILTTQQGRVALERADSCPSRMLRSSVAPLTVFPANSVSRGRASAIPVRLQTSAGLATLFDKLQEEDLSATAVVFDFDKVLANVPAACVDARDPSLVRGGLHTIRVLEMLRARGVPLFIATARASPMLLQDLVAKLGGVGAHPLLGFFAASAVGSAPVTAANGGIGEAAAAAAAENIIGTSVLVQEIRNESLRVKIRRVVDTNIFSAGYEKAKLIAHLIAHEIGPERRRVIFVDDNVFHAYFVLQEAPIHIHTQQPQRHCTVVSSWWDPSEEQSRGQMRVINDSDFSYTQAYQECLSAFGVDEPERIRTAGILLAKALLRGES